MRVGLIADAFDPHGGGAERWTAQLADHLLRGGHDVHLIAFRARDVPAGAQLHLLDDPGSVFGRARAVAAATVALRGMVLHDGGVGWSGHIYHPHTGSRVLSVAQETRSYAPWQRARAAITPWLRWRLWRMAQIERRAAAHAVRVIALSRRLRGLLAARHGLPDERLVVVGNGVDTQRFAPARLAPLRAPARRGLAIDTQLLCLMVAHNLRLKGFDIALRALAVLRGQGIVVRLVIAGGQPDWRWADLPARLGVAGQVSFAGDVAEIEHLYAAADLLVHPTRWDACSLATIEAMAAGLPVITTAMNGAADLIAHGRNGYVLDTADDHVTLARHIAALRDPATRRRVGACATATAAGADIAANCRRIEAVMAEVAGLLPIA